MDIGIESIDTFTREQFERNNLDFQRALDRIIKKYSRVQYEDDALVVDLNTADLDSLSRCMESYKRRLSFEGEDVPKPDAGHVSMDEMSLCSTTFLSDLETTIQPEDEDKELEMTLNSRNSSLADVYSSAVNHIGQAQLLQRVSKAADSIVRKYRKWRVQANASLNSSANASFRHKRQWAEAPNTGLGMSFSASRRLYPEDGGQDLTDQSPRRPSEVQQHAPKQERGYTQASPRKPFFVMDLSAISHLPTKRSGIQLNETFTMSDMQPSYEPSRHCIASSTRINSPPAKVSQDLSLRSKRLLLAAQQQANTKCSLYAPEFNVVETYDGNGSPDRQSLLKARLRNRDFRRSPYAFPKAFSMELPGTCSNLNSTSRFSGQLSPSQRAPDTHRLSQSGLRSKFRRHLSFDSSLHTKSSSYFQKNLDDHFTNVYHKYVCLNKSSLFASASCQKCAHKSETRRRLSSPALAALVSPHRVLMRKRYRDVDMESPPEAKRYRGSPYMPSPGSKRYSRDALRRCLYATDLPVPDENSFQSC
ncbi:uncharacterized protein ACB058_016435 [Synchiropus picturatus]